MKKYTLLSAALLFFGLGIFVFTREKQSMPNGQRVMLGGTSFSVEIADTSEKQERGLGYRDALCDTCGMFFVFDRPDVYGFWMKGMRFPLDILWIRDGKVIHIERGVDFHDQQKIYQPSSPADRVLELNAGTCEKRDIREGDAAVFEK